MKAKLTFDLRIAPALYYGMALLLLLAFLPDSITGTKIMAYIYCGIAILLSVVSLRFFLLDIKKLGIANLYYIFLALGGIAYALVMIMFVPKFI